MRALPANKLVNISDCCAIGAIGSGLQQRTGDGGKSESQPLASIFRILRDEEHRKLTSPGNEDLHLVHVTPIPSDRLYADASSLKS